MVDLPMKQWEPKGRERDRLNALLKGWSENVALITQNITT